MGKMGIGTGTKYTQYGSVPVPGTKCSSLLALVGFNHLHCQKAAIDTSNVEVEEAINWLLSQMDDPGCQLAIWKEIGRCLGMEPTCILPQLCSVKIKTSQLPLYPLINSLKKAYAFAGVFSEWTFKALMDSYKTCDDDVLIKTAELVKQGVFLMHVFSKLLLHIL
ncbi:putative ubiquitinyl hydrolase 1 [Helianthus annuus]|nr:putative ubiquitinyl hydrolase 1 [Helianthus annuus]